MAEKRPKGEREYSPLDDSGELIQLVLRGELSQEKQESPSSPLTKEAGLRGVVKPGLSRDRTSITKSSPVKENFAVMKFTIPREDYYAVKRILSELEMILNVRVDVSNLGRGWVTRLLTAEKEIVEAARNQGELKTPNSRNPVEIAELDYAMTSIQAFAFRRAKPIK